MLLNVKSISKTYITRSQKIKVFDNLSLTVNSGEFVAITGESGCGKSTFLRILGCMEKFDQGEYYFQDKNVTKLNNMQLSKLRNKCIGFVFQNFNLIPEYTVYENIEVPLGYAGVCKSKRVNRVNELLNLVNLYEKSKYYPSQLSGGQQQRIAIARALSNDPSVILADEPTGNLDIENLDLVMKLFRELCEKGITIVMVTHDEKAAGFADRIIKFSQIASY